MTSSEVIGEAIKERNDMKNKLTIKYSPVDCDRIELVSPNLYGGLVMVSKIRNNRLTKLFYNWNKQDDYLKFKHDFPLKFERFLDGEYVVIYYNDIAIFKFVPKDHIIFISKNRGKFEIEFIDEIDLFF